MKSKYIRHPPKKEKEYKYIDQEERETGWFKLFQTVQYINIGQHIESVYEEVKF